jgi:hypothetical protein
MGEVCLTTYIAMEQVALLVGDGMGGVGAHNRMMYGWLSSARMERSALTCIVWRRRRISLFLSCFNARNFPVALCFTSLTRPKPPVPATTPNNRVSGTHDMNPEDKRHVYHRKAPRCLKRSIEWRGRREPRTYGAHHLQLVQRNSELGVEFAPRSEERRTRRAGVRRLGPRAPQLGEYPTHLLHRRHGFTRRALLVLERAEILCAVEDATGSRALRACHIVSVRRQRIPVSGISMEAMADASPRCPPSHVPWLGG